MNARPIPPLVACATLALLMAGCGKSNKDQLPGAVYAASTVQVYKDAVLTNMMGNDSYGDEPGSHTKGQMWYFDVKDSKEKVLAFYEKQFPNAERTTLDGGAVMFRIIPEGAEKNESVRVTVGDGTIIIGEQCRPGKIKD